MSSIWNMFRGQKDKTIDELKEQNKKLEEQNNELKKIQGSGRVIERDQSGIPKEKLNYIWDMFDDDFNFSIWKNKVIAYLRKSFDENSLYEEFKMIKKHIKIPYASYLLAVFLRRKCLYEQNPSMSKIIDEERNKNVNEEYVDIHNEITCYLMHIKRLFGIVNYEIPNLQLNWVYFYQNYLNENKFIGKLNILENIVNNCDEYFYNTKFVYNSNLDENEWSKLRNLIYTDLSTDHENSSTEINFETAFKRLGFIIDQKQQTQQQTQEQTQQQTQEQPQQQTQQQTRLYQEGDTLHINFEYGKDGVQELQDIYNEIANSNYSDDVKFRAIHLLLRLFIGEIQMLTGRIQDLLTMLIVAIL